MIRLFSIILISVHLLPVCCQEVLTDQHVNISDPVIGFMDTEFDFGTLRSGSEAVHYFVFTNTGTKPLVISNVRSSCGCAVPEWPEKPVPGGGKDSLKVEYNTRIKGVFDKTILVYSNTSDGLTELRIKGNVIKTK